MSTTSSHSAPFPQRNGNLKMCFSTARGGHLLFISFHRQKHIEREREEERWSAHIRWFTPQRLQWLGLGQAEAESQNSAQNSHAGLEPSLLPPGTDVIRSWDLNLGAPLWDERITNGIFTAMPNTYPLFEKKKVVQIKKCRLSISYAKMFWNQKSFGFENYLDFGIFSHTQ